MCAAEGNLRGLQYEELGCVLGHAGTFASCRSARALGRKFGHGAKHRTPRVVAAVDVANFHPILDSR